MTSSASTPATGWKVPNTQELASMPVEELQPLAYGISRPWMRAWQDATNAPAIITLRKLAEWWNLPYDVLRKMRNCYFTPARRPALADLRKLATALAPAHIPYEVVLLASAGYLPEHPATERLLEVLSQEERAFMHQAFTWLYSQEWAEATFWRQRLITLLEEEQITHQQPLRLARSVAFLIGCWRALAAQGIEPENLEDLGRFL